MSKRETLRQCPVDFNHTTPLYADNWEKVAREMREECPRAWSNNFEGFWLASTFEDISAIAKKPEYFTSYKSIDPVTGVAKGGTSIPPLPEFRAVPSESDTEEWSRVRTFLNNRFSPAAIEKLRGRTAELVAAMIDLVIESGQLEFVDDLTNPVPAMVSMELFGFPLDQWKRFADPFHKMLFTPQDAPEYSQTLADMQFFREEVDRGVADRRAHPRDDLLTHLMHGLDSGVFGQDLLHDIAFNLMAGGIDTTTALTSNVLLFLSRNHGHRDRLIADLSLLPKAREEFVRYFTPVHAVGRTVTEDCVVNGWEFKKDERVFLRYVSANRDPAVFDRPEEVVLDRFPNRHISFGAGMHRCLGSFFARMMFDEMMKGVLTRMPDYVIDEAGIVHYPSIQQVNGWVHLPASFTAGKRVGASIT